jgi:hypothetical protein
MIVSPLAEFRKRSVLSKEKECQPLYTNVHWKSVGVSERLSSETPFATFECRNEVYYVTQTKFCSTCDEWTLTVRSCRALISVKFFKKRRQKCTDISSRHTEQIRSYAVKNLLHLLSCRLRRNELQINTDSTYSSIFLYNFPPCRSPLLICYQDKLKVLQHYLTHKKLLLTNFCGLCY